MEAQALDEISEEITWKYLQESGFESTKQQKQGKDKSHLVNEVLWKEVETHLRLNFPMPLH